MEIRGYCPISKGLSSRASHVENPKLSFLMDIRYFIGVDISKATAAADRPRLGRIRW